MADYDDYDDSFVRVVGSDKPKRTNRSETKRPAGRASSNSFDFDFDVPQTSSTPSYSSDEFDVDSILGFSKKPTPQPVRREPTHSERVRTEQRRTEQPQRRAQQPQNTQRRSNQPQRRQSQPAEHSKKRDEDRYDEPTRVTQIRSEKDGKAKQPSKKKPKKKANQQFANGQAAEKITDHKRPPEEPQKEPSGRHSGRKSSGESSATRSSPEERQRQRERERRQKEDLRRQKVKEKRDEDLRRNSGENSDKAKARVQKNVKKKNKILKIVIVAFVIVLVASVSFIVAAQKSLVVESIQIVNSEAKTYKKTEILEASDLSEGMSLLGINKAKVSEKIETKLPYINSVEIKKNWPDKITIKVSETTEKFAIMLGKTYVWVDGNGKVLSNTKKSIGKGQLKVIGFNEAQDFELGHTFEPSKDNKKIYEVLQKVSAGIDSSGLKIIQVDFSKENLVCLKYDEYISIYGNYKNNYKAKLSGVKEIISTKEKIQTAYYFDIRGNDEIRANYGEFDS